jgi:hypothetical protein
VGVLVGDAPIATTVGVGCPPTLVGVASSVEPCAGSCNTPTPIAPISSSAAAPRTNAPERLRQGANGGGSRFR